MSWKKYLILFSAAGLTTVATNALAADIITIDDTSVFPESLTSTTAGDIIIGSVGKGVVYRAKAGSATATRWLDPARTGLTAVLGVYADNRANTLYVCSISPIGKTPKPELSALLTFDLTTGAPKARYPMPNPDKAVCNDIDVDEDGTAYVTDTFVGQVLRLKRDSKQLDVWIKDERLAGIDGLALGDGVLYVNTVTTNRLFSIPIAADGAAGAILELKPSLPLAKPDGMRALGGNKFLMAENAAEVGRVTEVTVNGDKAEIKVLKVDPGVTAITVVGNKIWVDNAKFAYRDTAMKGKSPEPFVIYAIPLP